jgi:hypothetical protein
MMNDVEILQTLNYCKAILKSHEKQHPTQFDDDHTKRWPSESLQLVIDDIEARST